jgi:hypothetical protein
MRKETQHFEQRERKSMSSAEVAAAYVRRMVESETRGWGDTSDALRRLGVKYRLPYWTLNNLRIGRAKTVEASVYDRIKAAFAEQCRRQAEQLLYEADLAAAGTPNDDVAAIRDQIRALAARLEAAKGEKRGAAR